jgi:UDP-glucose 4-epimerase
VRRGIARPGGASLGGRRVLVTGGSGFIGTHVVRALTAVGAQVVVADLRPFPDPDVHCLVGDLTDDAALDAAVVPGIDAVVHLAAITSVLGSLQHPVETFRTNVAMTAALLERASATGVTAVVFASTNAVVGTGAGEGLIDESSPLRPLTPYGATKAAAEMLLSSSTASAGVRGVSLRFTNVYGPGMVLKDSVVARIMRAAQSGACFDIYGDGRQVRDYVYVDDVIAAIQLGLVSELSGPLVIGSGTSTSVLGLLEEAREATGTALPARHVAPKEGEMSGVRVDISRAASVGWRPQIDLAEGLARVWASWDGGTSRTSEASPSRGAEASPSQGAGARDGAR